MDRHLVLSGGPAASRDALEFEPAGPPEPGKSSVHCSNSLCRVPNRPSAADARRAAHGTAQMRDAFHQLGRIAANARNYQEARFWLIRARDVSASLGDQRAATEVCNASACLLACA
jgi:hypothetical protein